MYGLLWYDNICPIYNLIIWNMRVQKKKNIEKIAKLSKLSS